MVDESLPSEDLKLNALRFLTKLAAEIENTNLPDLSSVIIGGATRCGKTKLAKLIQKDLKMFHLKSDDVKRNLYSELKGKHRRWTASYIFKEILTLFPRGVIVEGTVFTQYAKNFPRWEIPSDIPVYLIGSTTNFEKKYEAMLAFRNNNLCWTSIEYSESELLNLAERITEDSIANRELCIEQGYTYFDARPNEFERDINEIAARIQRTLTLQR